MLSFFHRVQGWWLSMKKEDRFCIKLKPSENLSKLFQKMERFGTVNNATLGFVVYADDEIDIFKDKIYNRVPEESTQHLPNTTLANSRKQEDIRKLKEQKKAKDEYNKYKDAVDAFLELLKKHNKDKDDKIKNQTLTDVLKETEAQHFERLFGMNITVEDVVEAVDEDDNGEVDLEELGGLIGRNSAALQAKFVGYQRTEIRGAGPFFKTILSALMINVDRANVETFESKAINSWDKAGNNSMILFKDDDSKRTVGINTRYVRTTDFKLEQQDKDFLVKQGRIATESFLRFFVKENSKT